MALTKRSLVRAAAAAIATAGLTGVLLVTPAGADVQPITLEMSECGVMAIGTTGTCIYSLQTWMSIATGAPLVRDSYFGPGTDHAVRIFQQQQGLDPDGRFGPQSRAALRRWWQDVTSASVPTPRPAPDDSVATPRLQSVDEGAAEPGLFSAEEAETYCHVMEKAGRESVQAKILGAEFETLCRVVLGP